MKILIIGGTGYLGKHLVESYLSKSQEVAVFSRDEAKHWELIRKNPKVKSYLGDVTKKEDLDNCFAKFKPTHIIIAAAMKNIVLVEEHPFQGVKTNILGLENILKCCDEQKDITENVVFVSTDKAADPINVYGMTKSICEKICIGHKSNYQINVVRYGNVLNSTGSIIPILNSCVKDYELTHSDMTRFLMTVYESIDLINYVLFSKELDRNICIPLLKSMKIKDLLEIYAEKRNKKIIISGIRPGEKIHEKLISDNEVEKCYLKDKYIIVPKNQIRIQLAVNPMIFSSDNCLLTKEELKTYLAEKYLL